MKSYDVVIIGGGPGGYNAAIRATTPPSALASWALASPAWKAARPWAAPA